MTVHLLVPQLEWMARTPYTACLRPARNLQTTSLSGKIRCKECRRIRKAALGDREHPLYFYFHQGEKITRIESPEDIWDYVRVYTFQDREAIHAMYTDTKQQVLDIRLLSIGTSQQALITPTMVFRPAMELGALHVYMVHNHPSGDCCPSTEDLTLTGEYRRAGNLLGINLVDHVVCTPNEYISIRERYMYIFS